MELDTCLARGYLKIISSDVELSNKELAESEDDFSKARAKLLEKDYKWSIIMSYYSMFHAAKAILFQLGYAEKKHFAISAVLEDMAKQGRMKSVHVNNFKGAMAAREESNYHYTYPLETAEFELENAEVFLEEVKKILSGLK